MCVVDFILKTRMHSSRMRTGHSLTICQSLLLLCLLPGGLLLGVSAPRGVSAPWGVSAPGGCLLWGVSAPKGGVSALGVSALGSVCSQGGGGVSSWGCIPSCTGGGGYSAKSKLKSLKVPRSA